MVPSKTPTLINNIIWGAIEDKPDEIKDIEQFKKMITLRDREAILYGIYCSTFGDEEDFKVTCRKCEHEENIKLSMSKIFSINAYPGSESMMKSYQIAKISGDADYDKEIENNIHKRDVQSRDIPPTGMPPEIAKLDYDISSPDDDDGIIIGKNTNDIKFVEDVKDLKPQAAVPKVEKANDKSTSILDKRIDIKLPVSKVHAILKQPTIYDEESSLKSMAFAQKAQIDLINEIIVIERFEQYNPGDKSPSTIISDKEDILFEYEKLPPKDKKEIFDKFTDEFGQYGIDLKAKYGCSSCNSSNELEVNISIQFFRMVAQY
jgi:hypothetical protein